MNILNAERNANFNDFSLNKLESSKNKENFKLVLANSGVTKYDELGDLIYNQNQNAFDFIAENKDFKLLKESTKQTLILDAVHDAVIENPINLQPIDVDDNTILLTCREQFKQDQNDCNEQNNIVGAGVIVACISSLATGPGFFLTCGSSSAIAIWQNNTCQRNAKRDYQNCIND